MKYSLYIDYTKGLFNKVLNNITELNSIIITDIFCYLTNITLAYNTILETIILQQSKFLIRQFYNIIKLLFNLYNKIFMFIK
jgi:hypothetical protein